MDLRFLSGLLVTGLLVGLWLVFGTGPRRRRAYRRARTHLDRKAWRPALEALRKLRKLGTPSRKWQSRMRQLQGDCEQLAGDAALEEHRYEESLDHYRVAAPLLGIAPAQFRRQVLESMLIETRRLFAILDDPGPLHSLLQRVLQLQPGCAEARFWQGLTAVREGQNKEALAALRESAAAREPVPIGFAGNESSREQAEAPAGPRALDPLLYLGALLLREGEVQEAVRLLSEANKIYADCPFVHWQLGTALVAGGGDTLAVRALQKALGPQGLARWVKTPQQAWIEGFPGAKPADDRAPAAVSFVRRLAEKHMFRCPIFGHDIAAIIRQAQITQALAYTRLGRHQDAAGVYQSVLQDHPPTLPVLRGLGLALARLGQYDQAFKHLRAAFEMEQPKNHLTAGYLALCAARGTPSRPEDRGNNLQWALQLLGRFSIEGDPEWARLCGSVLAAAKLNHVPVSAEAQVRLCDALASVDATWPEAALAYEELAATAPDSVRPEYAWLYCRAAQVQSTGTSRGLGLFARTFRDESAARRFFAERQWNFDDVEYTYLRWLAAGNGELERGKLADAGALGAAQETLLLNRSRAQEEAGQLDEARNSAEILLHLVPNHCGALDRLASVSYHLSNFDQAVQYLEKWQTQASADPLPWVRRAVLERQRGQREACFAALDQALQRSRGHRRADLAFLGARLALGLCPASERRDGATAWEQVRAYLETCLQEQPKHAAAQAYRAALLAATYRRADLAGLAPVMEQLNAPDAIFQFMTSLCHLAAGAPTKAIEAAQSAQAQASNDGASFPLARECTFVIGSALYLQNDSAAATTELARVVEGLPSRLGGEVTRATPQAATGGLPSPLGREGNPSANQARALLGRMAFEAGQFESAASWWQAIDPAARTAWGFGGPLRQTLLLTGLSALRDGRFENALAQFQAALASGDNDPRLRSLAQLARLRATQRLLYSKSTTTADLEAAVDLLHWGTGNGTYDRAGGYLLALAYKRLHQETEARQVLRQIVEPDAHVYLQAGLLALRASKTGMVAPLQQAVQEWEKGFALIAEPVQPDAAISRESCFALGYNLLRGYLSLGQLAPALSTLSHMLTGAKPGEEQRLLSLLQAALLSCQEQNRDPQHIAHLAEITDADEQRFLYLVRSLGHLDMAEQILQPLSAARPQSPVLTEARLEVTVLLARRQLERCAGQEGTELLTPVARRKDIPPQLHVALLNVLGCCRYLQQDYEGAGKAFAAALQGAESDVRVHQNMALACEAQAQALARTTRFSRLAQEHWNRYLDLLGDRIPAPPRQPVYWENVKFECLRRLAQQQMDQKNAAAALEYVEQAQALRPDDADIVEKRFHLYNTLQRFDEAKEALVRLRTLREDSPALGLFELEFAPLRELDDADRMLNDLDRILAQNPLDASLNERAGQRIDAVIELLSRLNREAVEELHKKQRTLERLPSYQVNWVEVNDFLRMLRTRLLAMRRLIDKSLALSGAEAQQRQLKRLRKNVEGEVEMCRNLGA